MPSYGVRLAKPEEIAEGTMAFHFEKPAGFSFKPGQAIDVVLDSPCPHAQRADAQSYRHTFSIASAPFEDELVVAMRMRDSAFKRALKSLPLGSLVKLEGPVGLFTLHEDRARPAVFIAGGIDITPS
jgi:ferredoxin-NADP reductase